MNRFISGKPVRLMALTGYIGRSCLIISTKTTHLLARIIEIFIGCPIFDLRTTFELNKDLVNHVILINNVLPRRVGKPYMFISIF